MEQVFLINEFSGPIDLLLHLVKCSKMDICDIKIEEVTKQYIDYINKMEELNIDIASEYLTFAGELIHLKSRILLNDTSSEESSEFDTIVSEEDLKNKLLEYQKYKEITGDFKFLEQKRTNYFTKLPSLYEEYIDPEKKVNSDLTINDLVSAFEEFLKRQNLSKPLKTKITKKELSIEDQKVKIREILNIRKRIDFFELFTHKDKENLIVTFLSILDMSRQGEVNIIQDNNFSNIYVEKM